MAETWEQLRRQATPDNHAGVAGYRAVSVSHRQANAGANPPCKQGSSFAGWARGRGWSFDRIRAFERTGALGLPRHYYLNSPAERYEPLGDDDALDAAA